MANLTATISPQVSVNHTGTSGASTTTDYINQNPTFTLAYGTGAGQGDTVYSATGTLAASTPVTIDFSSAGSLKDAFGNSISFARIRTIFVYNQATNDAYSLNLGAAGTFPLVSPFGGVATSKLTVAAGGIGLLHAPLTTGFVVSTGSACQLKLDPGSNAVPYTIVVVGCSV